MSSPIETLRSKRLGFVYPWWRWLLLLSSNFSLLSFSWEIFTYPGI